ncbi:MAG: hypothetical protein B6D35_05100 [Candidatus Brocadia sp. UTAMX2]|jgi:hypothetical protein|nr:MAG: hypothetical protein B6D35_05100 [Candidatus Brocadia sp. UTAMX2]
MENNIRIRAREWFEKADHDFDAVNDILKGSGHPDVAGVLLQQGVEKYLKGYLISKGWKLVKTHDLKQLLDEDEAVKHINRLIIEHTLSCPFSASILEKKSIRRINTIMRPLIIHYLILITISWI